MNVHVTPREARRTPEWFEELPDVLEEAFDELDFEESEAYGRLQELASAVRIEGHSIDAESSVIDGGKWIAPASVYITLIYDPMSQEPVEIPDSYPMTIFFDVDDKHVVIEKVTVDTSSFYE